SHPGMRKPPQRTNMTTTLSQRHLSAPRSLPLILAVALLSSGAAAAPPPNTITLTTPEKPLVIRPIRHASVLLEFRGKTYYVDPAQLPANTAFPKADAILITHEHYDHCDPASVARIRKPGTVIIGSAGAIKVLGTG